MSTRQSRELASFERLWGGGYYEGDPLAPMSRSGYGQLGYMSILHATYLRCIKPYVHAETVALEIGPGRGAWTKALLPSREVYALDALSAEHNGFFEYLGQPENVTYIQVRDFACADLPEDHFDYMFSFGCLCHVSFDGIREYAQNLHPKLKSGSTCFWMVADYAKYNAAISNRDKLSIWAGLMPRSRRRFWSRLLFTRLMNRERLELKDKDTNDEPQSGRWYDAGIERTCAMLRDAGYRVVDPDVGTSLRDPIIHFVKE